MVQKVVVQMLAWVNWQLENSNPAVNGYFFSNQGRIRQQEERDGQSAFHMHIPWPRYNEALTPTAPRATLAATRLWKTFTF